MAYFGKYINLLNEEYKIGDEIIVDTSRPIEGRLLSGEHKAVIKKISGNRIWVRFVSDDFEEDVEVTPEEITGV